MRLSRRDRWFWSCLVWRPGRHRRRRV